MSKIVKLVVLMSLVLCSWSCRRSGPVDSGVNSRLAGSVKNSVYTSRSERYSVPVPGSPSVGTRISEKPYGVGFTDDFGELHRIEVVPIPENERSTLDILDRREYLESILTEVYMPGTILKAIPSASVAYRKWHDDVHGGALYAEVTMPKGSISRVSVDGGPAKRVDSERGLLLFVNGGDLCVISTTLPNIGPLNADKNEQAKSIRQALQRNTLDFMKTIYFRPAS